jgi:hypothetical protein
MQTLSALAPILSSSDSSRLLEGGQEPVACGPAEDGISDPVDSMTCEDREHTLFEPALFSACGR